MVFFFVVSAHVFLFFVFSHSHHPRFPIYIFTNLGATTRANQHHTSQTWKHDHVQASVFHDGYLYITVQLQKKKVNTYNLERELFICNLDMYISQKKGGNGFITSLPPFNWLKVRFGFWNVAVLKLTLGVGSFKKCEYV